MGQGRRLVSLAAAAVLLIGALPNVAGAAEPNTPPVAVDDPGEGCGIPALGGMFPILEDPIEPMTLALTCAPLRNDFDLDGGVMIPELVSQPAHGTATIWGDEQGTFDFATYMQDPDFSTLPGDVPGGLWESDSFTYRVTDGQDWSNGARYRVWVAPINDPPTFTAGPNLVEVDQDSGPYSGQWAIDIDPGPYEANQQVHFEVTVDLNGLPHLFDVDPAIGPDGTLTFTPGLHEYGLSEITVRVVDDGGLQDYGESGMLSELPDDTSDPITFEIVVWPNNPPEIGVDADLPVAKGAGPTRLDLLANDTDPDDDALRISAVTEPQHGSATIIEDGAFVAYDPEDTHVGLDWFEYTIEDARGGSASLFVTLAVGGSTNRAPVAVDDPSGSCVVLPGIDAFVIVEDPIDPLLGVVGCDPLANDFDPDGDPLSYEIVTQPAHGLAIAYDDTYISYMPEPEWNSDNANGPWFEPVLDSFTYRAFDGAAYSAPATVSYWVGGINDTPTFTPGTDVHVLQGSGPYSSQWATDVDAGPNEGWQTLHFELDPFGSTDSLFTVPPTIDEHGVLTFTPAPGHAGFVSYGVQLVDDGGLYDAEAPELLREQPDDTSDPFVFTVFITPNAPPRAEHDLDIGVAHAAGPTLLDVLANDSDMDGDTLSIIEVTQPAHGVVAIVQEGQALTYDPTDGYAGADAFTYTIADGHGGTAVGVVTVSVVPDSVAPTVGKLTRTIPAQTIGSTTVTVRYGWSGLDAGTGIARYQLERSLNGGSFRPVTLSSPTATATNATVALGTSYRYRVRATDRAGNVGPWAYWATVTPTRYQETSSIATYTGTWTRVTSTSLSGGSARYATSSTRRLRFTFTGRDVALIASQRTTGGRAQIRIDGVLVSTIDLDSSSTRYRRAVFAKDWSSKATHTLEIRPLGDGRVEVDAIVVLR